MFSKKIKVVLILALTAVVVLVAVLVSARSKSKDVTVSDGEVVPALTSTGYRMKFRDVWKPESAKEVVAGRAYARDGSSVDFSVEVFKGKSIETNNVAPVVPYTDELSDSSLGNVRLTTNYSTKLVGVSARQQKTRLKMALDIEDAVFNLMSDLEHVG